MKLTDTLCDRTRRQPHPPENDSPSDMDAATFERVRQLIYQSTGIVIGEGKKSMLRARLSKRLAATGLSTIQQYLELLGETGSHRERSDFISAVTTNVTQFFREQHHFERLDSIIRERNGARNTLRVWSAGCSSGQEAYSIAMTLARAGRDSSNSRVLATDIDRNMLAKASSATYAAREVGTIPEPMQSFGIEIMGDRLTIKANIRSMVQVRALNLIDAWPFKAAFDVIFCRNLAIYFDAKTQHRLWARMIDALVPGGWLFVGHSERLPDTLSDHTAYAGQTSYQKTNSRNGGGL